MADPHVLSALQDKAHELRQAIVSYEEHLDRARHELAVVTAALTIFERDGGRITDARPSHVRNLFKRGEVIALCREALAAEPGRMTTRELAVACLGARGFDHGDPVLVRAMVGLLSNTLKKAVRRSEVMRVESAARQRGLSQARNDPATTRPMAGYSRPAGLQTFEVRSESPSVMNWEGEEDSNPFPVQ